MELSHSKSQNGKPARRRLQKIDPKLKKAKRASADSTISTNFNNYNVGFKSPSQRQMGSFGNTTLPTPPDLSDSKWNHYVDQAPPRTAPPAPVPEPQWREFSSFREPRQRLVPEFSHLKIQTSNARPSLDGSSSIPSPASTASTTASSALRRKAKTPVFKIGQLENLHSQQSIEVPEKASPVELLAEEYRTLIGPHDLSDMESTYGDSQLDRQTSRDVLEVPYNYSGRKSSESSRSMAYQKPPKVPEHQRQYPKRPPTPDDAGLVSFEEDAIYFKPISFSPEPSPRPSFESLTPSQSSEDSLGLQVCFDLLTRELGSTIAARPQRAGPDTAALQILVMIEAYERLRNQVFKMDLKKQQKKQVELMFNTWLSALYSIHNSMTGGQASESEYDGLEEDVD